MVDIDTQKIKMAGDYIRYLSTECIERSQSGHPGLPLGCADLGAILYRYIMRYSAADPTWVNRDRFILSAGHGSMFLYSLIHMAGFDLSLDDLSNFRQLHSRTPGHPELETEIGIEMTAGPLGQGFASSVGSALEGKMLAARFNRDGFQLFDYNVYTLMGDGCTMEGVSYEAASVAGHLGLDNLIAIYDSNDITIDGSTDITLSEDVTKRYESLGWEVYHCKGVELQNFYDTLKKATKAKGKPKMIVVRTTIGEGLNKMRGTHKIHGAPAGLDEICYLLQNSAVRPMVEKEYGADIVNDIEKLKAAEQQRIADKKPPFAYPEAVDFFREASQWNEPIISDWKKMMDEYQVKFPDAYEELQQFLSGGVPDTLRDKLINFKEEKPTATRGTSGVVLNMAAAEMPQIVGGSADLVGSTKATITGSQYVNRDDFQGRNIAFGIREHGMGAIGNGLALNGKMIPFTSTFFTFFDYMKPAVRLAALMQLRHLFVFTHDSIYVGEDGPTHQPIEHLNSLRLLPGIYTFRPGNDFETAFSYLYFLDEMDGPAAILGSRQGMPASAYEVKEERKSLYESFKKGAYVSYDCDDEPEVVVCGSGSEAGLAIDSARQLADKGIKARAVSIPCLELFEEQGPAYRKELFGNAKVAMLETASYRGVSTFFDPNILLIDIRDFGLSAPAGQVAAEFGFTAEKVAAKVQEFIK